MKKKYYIIFSIVLLSYCCSSEEQNCMGSNSTFITQEFFLPPFNEISINDHLKVFIKDSTHQKIVLKLPESISNQISMKIIDNKLEITSLNECTFFKNLSAIEVYITSPNIKKIRNASRYSVTSLGVLNYPTLQLITENYLSNYLNSGDFNLTVNSEKITLTANGPSNHTLIGNTAILDINFAGSNPRFNGKELQVLDAIIFGRSTNDILLNATNSVSGNLYSTGNVILCSAPLQINLTANYKGKIIKNY